MAMKHNSMATFKKRLLAEVARDKKKAIILGLLLLTAAYFIGKLFLAGGPQSVTAAPLPSGISAESVEPDTGMIKLPDLSQDKADAPKTSITRDIFKANPKVFPPVAIADSTGDNGPKVIKASQDDRQAALKELKEKIRKEGLALNLESTIGGVRPMAIINGSVLGPGGVINGFRIVKIDSLACVVEKEGIQLSLTMK